MKMKRKNLFCMLILFCLLSGLIVSAHGAESASENKKPVALIDGTLKVKVGEKVYLDGTLSSDPGGANLDYSWTLLSSPKSSLAIISSSSDPQASFEGDIAGTYKVKLIVNNGLTDSDPAYAEIIVTE